MCGCVFVFGFVFVVLTCFALSLSLKGSPTAHRSQMPMDMIGGYALTTYGALPSWEILHLLGYFGLPERL